MKIFASSVLKLVLLLTPLIIAGPTVGQVKAKPGATLKGRITIRGKGVPGIVVYARPQTFNSQDTTYKATSDQDGNYTITDIPPGGYHLQVIPLAYASKESKSVVVNDGETAEGFDFSLTRGGVITGKITNAENKPLIEERVNLFSAEPVQGARQIREQIMPPLNLVITDDRGIYRIYGLVPGRYRIAVGRNERNLFDIAAMGKKLYPQTFHPGVQDAEKATIIEVGDGTESTNVDVVVESAVQTFTATGRVINVDTNQPVPNIRFGLRTVVEGAGGGTFLGTTTASNSRGEFRMENLMPGKFATMIFPAEGDATIGDPLTFDVVDQDVTGLELKVRQGSTITGTVVLESGNEKEFQEVLPRVRLNSWVRNSESSPVVPQHSLIGANGSFRLAGLPAGTVSLSFSYVGGPWRRPFTIARVERDGAAQPQGLQVKAGEQISGVRIVILYGTATVRGTIKVENGPVPPDTRFHVQVNQKSGEQAQVNPVMVDARGKFLIEYLPVGAHELMVIASGPGLKGRPVRVIHPITVTDGVNEVTVVLDMLAPQEPPRP